MFEGLKLRYFATIAADPGTKFDVRSAKGITSRAAESKYTTLKDAEIAALPVGDYAARDAFLFYWDTTPRVAVGRHIPIMQAWGFTPCAIAFVWAKTLKHEELFLYGDSSFHFGAGYTTRKNTEICVLGRRGKPARRARDVRELIISPRREHSRKPDEFYARVERFCDGPRLELFGRQQRAGWIVRGDQSEKFA